VLGRPATTLGHQVRLAVMLAWVGGFTNVVGVMACGEVISHVTGGTTRIVMGADLATPEVVGISAWILAWFASGAVASGLLTGVAHARGWQAVHARPMAVEAVALAVLATVVELHDPADGSPMEGTMLLVGTAAGAFAMGLQNATITRISGGVVRTTHLTGVVTDLGLELSRLVVPAPGPAPDPSLPWSVRHQRLLVLAAILASFVAGAAVAAPLYLWSDGRSMIVPALFVAWIILQDARRPIRGEAP
jgi:uncharacterized membrane protein YoaK (UPF0700 family)